jgi:hypothetical protein
MRVAIKLVLAGLATAIVLSLAVGGAFARRFETSERGFLARWTAERPLILGAAGNRISCPVTLEGSFHSRTLSKVCGQLVGYITAAQISGTEPPCKGGTMTVLGETLPWHVQYNSFAGTLPNIARIRIALVGIQITARLAGLGNLCLITTTQANPTMADFRLTGGRAESLTLLPEFTFPLAGAACFLVGNGSFEGATAVLGTLVVPQVSITVRLVQ